MQKDPNWLYQIERVRADYTPKNDPAQLVSQRARVGRRVGHMSRIPSPSAASLRELATADSSLEEPQRLFTQLMNGTPMRVD